MSSTLSLRPWERLALALAGAVAALWLWRCWCIFPLHPWNELRLQPSFLLAAGEPFYPGPATGPATTWLYGPLPVLLFWPATLAVDAAAALLTAAGLNLLHVVGPLAAFCLLAPSPVGPVQRGLAVVACIAFWPGSSLHYLQADNLVVACGLAGALLLLRRPNAPVFAWAAAGCAVAALACKQTALEVGAAQLAWSWAVQGRAAAAAHFGRLAACGLLAAGVAVALFGASPLAFHLLALPGALPWAEEPGARLAAFAPWLALHVFAPALFLVAARRQVWTRSSPLLLPALLWLAALPPGLAGLLKIGGTINSLHGLLYLLPAALLLPVPATSRRRAGAAVLALAATVLGYRLLATPTPVWRPLVEHLRQADFLAREFPGQIWFPWNPLVTTYREQRHDHTEDGLVIRQLAGRALDDRRLRENLPPHWRMVALPTAESNWGLARALCPPGAQTTTVGLWTVHSWLPAPPGPPPPP